MAVMPDISRLLGDIDGFAERHRPSGRHHQAAAPFQGDHHD